MTVGRLSPESFHRAHFCCSM